VDALNRAEGESWVYKGHTIYRPRDGSPPTRTLLELSRGGADAVVLRELDHNPNPDPTLTLTPP
jgi:prolyl oligopeptidase